MTKKFKHPERVRHPHPKRAKGVIKARSRHSYHGHNIDPSEAKKSRLYWKRKEKK